MTTVIVPSIEAVSEVTKFKKCKKCAKRILQPSHRVVHCDYCKKDMRFDKCPTSIYTAINIEVNANDGKNEMELTIFEDVLRQLMGDPAMDAATVDPKTIADKLLFLDNVTITYNSITNIVTDIYSS